MRWNRILMLRYPVFTDKLADPVFCLGALKKDFAQTMAWFQCLLQVSKMSGTARLFKLSTLDSKLLRPLQTLVVLDKFSPHQSMTHQAQQNSFQPGDSSVRPAVRPAVRLNTGRPRPVGCQGSGSVLAVAKSQTTLSLSKSRCK